jgi:mannose-6-phosphate isomerase-like protein (cupin superfamily)
MTTITRDDIVLAKQQKKMHISRNFMPKNLSWSDIGEVYDLDKNVVYISWASFQAQERDIVFSYYKHVLDTIGEIYQGHPLFGMIIVHLVSRNNNTVTDPDFLSLYNRFFENNPKKMPEHMIIRDHGLDGDSWDSTIHFDKENRVYVQGGGQTMWKLFDDSHNLTDAIILNPGDLVFIPKGLVHSVESLGPRHSLSIALSDDPVI